MTSGPVVKEHKTRPSPVQRERKSGSQAAVVTEPLLEEPPYSLLLRLQQQAPGALRRRLAKSIARLGLLIGADFAVVSLLTYMLAWLAGFGGLFSAIPRVLPTQHLLGGHLGLAVVLGLGAVGAYGAGDRYRDASRIIGGAALGGALVLWSLLSTATLLDVLLQFAALQVVLSSVLLGSRWVFGALSTANGLNLKSRAVLVGGRDVRDQMEGLRFLETGSKFEHAIFLDPESTNSSGHTPRNLAEILSRERIDTVVLCGAMTDEELNSTIENAITAGCRVLVAPAVLDVPGIQPRIVTRRGHSCIELAVPSLRAQQFAIKRIVDIVGASAGLIVLSPALLALGLLIKLTSPGSVLFLQQRVGLGGRVFRMLKFRTMCADADSRKPEVAHLNRSGDPRLFKVPGDPRITRVGRWLRRWSLDELPQLWNVLAGDMSLVGPRPFFETDLTFYENHHFRRLGAKPGITGLWQVSGRSDIVDFEQVVSMDTEYVREWSLGLDIRILLRTLPAVLRRRGAI